LLEGIESNRRGRIKKGKINLVAHENDILRRRDILTETYAAAHKILSNHVHFSMFCERQMAAATGGWEDCWSNFYAPCHFVASLVAELLIAFTETYPWTAHYLTESDMDIVAKWRGFVKNPNWEPPRSNPAREN
jgi:hypothetical protein